MAPPIFVNASDFIFHQTNNDMKPVSDFINGTVTYDKFGGQYFWIKGKDGGSQMLAELRGWGAIQNLKDFNKGGKVDESAAGEYQDRIGEWIAEAINEKLQHEAKLKRASLPLSEITDQDAIGAAKIIFPSMEWEVKRYEKHIYYLDVVEKTALKGRWRINIFWLANDIKLWRDNDGEESIERGGKIIVDAYRYLESKGYILN